MAHDNLIEKAQAFARTIYGERKNVFGTSETKHAETVAKLVQLFRGTEEEIAVAWLYNSVRSGATTIHKVGTHFGPAVARIVDRFTDPPSDRELPDIDRKIHHAVRMFDESGSVRLVRLASIVVETNDLIDHPPAEWGTRTCFTHAVINSWIADACRGVSSVLDKQSDELHQDAKAKFRA